MKTGKTSITPTKPEAQSAEKRGLKSWHAWLGGLVSLACCVLAVWGIQLDPLLQATQKLQWGWASLALACSIATLLAKAARWSALFKPAARLPFRQAFPRLMIGILLNMVVPARLGDLVRAIPGKDAEGTTAFALGTIVLEKAMDAFLLGLTLLLLLTRLALPDWLISPSRDLGLAVAVFFLLLAFSLWKRGWIVAMLNRLVGKLPRPMRSWALRQGISGLSSLEILRYPRLTLVVLLWSVLILMLGVATNLLAFWSVGLQAGLWPAIALLIILQVGVAVPSSPGRIGVFQYLTILALGLFNYNKEAGLLTGVLLHVVVFLPILLFGSWYIWKGWPQWAALIQRARRGLSRQEDPGSWA